MDHLTPFLIGLVILALLVVGFFAVFRGRGKFQLDTKLGKLRAEGENPPPPASIASGVRIKDAKAGRDLRARSASEGGIDLDKVEAEGDIDATHTPGEPPPKA